MTRNSIVAQPQGGNNGEHPGHATEPASVAEAALSFGPAELEQIKEPGPDAPDPFDPDTLRIGPGFEVATGVKKALLTVPVRKPSKAAFVQVHPDADYSVETFVLDVKDERTVYLVDPHLWQELATEPTFCPISL